MATLELSAGEVCDVVETYTGNTTAGNAIGHVKAGYDRFLAGTDPRTNRAHVWSFLQPISTITIWATATGAASGAPVKDNGTSTVTSAAAMFYASMVGHDVAFTASGNSYEITAYTSSTVVTVSGDASAEADADVLTVTADGAYSLPSAFGGLVEKPVYEYSSTLSTLATVEVSPKTIYSQWRLSNTAGVSRYLAIVPKDLVQATGQEWKLIVSPVPEDTQVWRYRYSILADDITDSATVYFLGGTSYSYLIRQLSLADAEYITGRTRGIHEAKAIGMMSAAVGRDDTLFITNDVERLEGGP